MTRLHLDNVAELIVKNFQNPGWRKHGGKTCGLTARDYGYRKGWLRERLKQLAGAMAIDVLDYAILGNHLHLVLRNRPDLVSTWSDEEVARRWWLVCPLRRNEDGTIPAPCIMELRCGSRAAEHSTRLAADSPLQWRCDS
jgi:hypothetical protein